MKDYEEIKTFWDEPRNGFPFSISLNHSVAFWWKGNCNHSWKTTITNKKQFGCPVCVGKLIQQGVNDFESNNKNLMKEWHPTKNINIIPSKISQKSSKKVWWVCELGHEWEARVLHRVNGSTCPYCAGKYIFKGFNDLQTTHPDIAEKWHPELNLKDVTEYGSGSKYKAWWFCEKDHAYERLIYDQIRFNAECCYCSNNKLLTGFNDLQTTFPELSLQWHPTKNVNSPDNVIKNFSKKVWWVCELGHEWESSPAVRVRKNSGCPACAGNIVVIGFNDLAINNPVLAAEWHPTKNGSLTPQQVTKSSSKKVWWLGKECGHEWEAQISNRNNGANCNVCRYKKSGMTKRNPTTGVTDLLSQNPKIAAEWHSYKNSPLKPSEVNVGSNRKVWWQCDKNHEWETKIVYRTGKHATGCPECSAKTFSSKPEAIIFSFIKELFPQAEKNSRKILPNNQELDIYIPEKNIAIEFNGLYWHSEKFKPKTYHYDKWLQCKNQGIKLIQIWEDDWNRNPELIKRMLAHKLNVSTQLKVYARETMVVDLTTQQAITFLNKNHIQGYGQGSYYLGLWDKSSLDKGLVAVLVVKKEAGTGGKTLNIIRYATSKTVVGGFTKLLKYVEKTYTPESIITFSDNTISNGDLYKNNGFIADKNLKPDYMYVVNGVRKHKFGYRLKKFRNDPELKYKKDLTEKELAELNNLPRIWDAGKIRWVKNMPQ